jgi:hypothetical protein
MLLIVVDGQKSLPATAERPTKKKKKAAFIPANNRQKSCPFMEPPN